ncbi:MAG: helix-turn-helix domain-containing protein [Legionellales bacterium]|nr:helix-turn-helix domain-containing protein [Legionellales bacterium]
MNYKERINKVIDFIGKHLDDEFTLDQLSAVACFSKYHFHRLFTAYTGLSLRQYIRWLRLKRAAHQLIVDKDRTVIEIALNAGFESHESFTRAFKQICGISPSHFRFQSNWHIWENPPYSLPQQGEKKMIVEIKNLPARRLAVLEHHGDPQQIGETVNQLIAWAKDQPINLKPEPGEAFGFAYNDPKQVPANEFRFDLAMTVPNHLKLKGAVVEKELPAGKYAVAVHKGSRDNISDTIYGLYRDWLPKSNEELGNLPCIFCYYNFDHEVAETELLTECWLLLK